MGRDYCDLFLLNPHLLFLYISSSPLFERISFKLPSVRSRINVIVMVSLTFLFLYLCVNIFIEILLQRRAFFRSILGFIHHYSLSFQKYITTITRKETWEYKTIKKKRKKTREYEKEQFLLNVTTNRLVFLFYMKLLFVILIASICF